MANRGPELNYPGTNTYSGDIESNNHQYKQPLLYQNGQPENNYFPVREQNSILVQPNENVNRQQAQMALRNDVRHQINRSPLLNTIQIFFSLCKIIVSIIFIKKYDGESCSSPLDTFLWLNVACDSFNLITAVYDIHLQRRARRQNQDLQDEDNRLLQGMIDLKYLMFIIVFIFGNFWVFDVGSNCQDRAPHFYALSLTYVIFGYLYILYPLLLIICLCLCLPCIIFIVIRFNLGSSQKPATQSVIKDQPTEKFDRNVHTEPQCIICMEDYEENQDLIRLNCSGKHYFHSHCIKNWLVINGVCPFCRQRLE